jgi:hypothetical protein
MINALLSGWFSYAERTGDYNAFYSRLLFNRCVSRFNPQVDSP